MEYFGYNVILFLIKYEILGSGIDCILYSSGKYLVFKFRGCLNGSDCRDLKIDINFIFW